MCTVIRLDHVEDSIRRMGDEFPRGVRKGNRVLLQLLSKFRYRKDPIQSAFPTTRGDELTNLSVFPEIPINPSGHILAVNDDACSSVS